MKKLKIGFVGVGFMGQLAHLSNYSILNEECEIAAIAEPRKGLAEEVARRYGVKQVFHNHMDLINNCKVDAIVASQHYNNHINIIPDILNAKIPVFTEKPLCISVETGEKLVKYAEDNKTLHMVGYHKRSDPAVEYAKKLITEWKTTGEYGKMRMVRITMPPGDWIGGSPGPISTNEPQPDTKGEGYPDYFDIKTADFYNAFVNYYIHQVNAMHFLLGEPYKVTFADKSCVLLVVESESGVCGTIEMNTYCNSIDWQEMFFVGFEKGYINVELPPPLASQQAGRVTVMRDNGRDIPTTTQPHMPRLSAMRNQAKNFLAAVRGERPAPCISKEALCDLGIAKDYTLLLLK